LNAVRLPLPGKTDMMKNKKGQLIVAIVVLFPLIFFLSMALRSNQASIADDTLKIEGAGGVDIPLKEISKAVLLDSLPEITNAGNFSLGLVKKGDFQRVSDGAVVRVIKNNSTTWIHLFTDRQEVYFNLSEEEETAVFYRELERVITEDPPLSKP